MPKDFYPELVRILRAAVWRQVPSGKGSHEKWHHEDTGRTLIVPPHQEPHTANEILKDAGLPKAF